MGAYVRGGRGETHRALYIMNSCHPIFSESHLPVYPVFEDEKSNGSDKKSVN